MVSSTPRAQDACTFDPELQSTHSFKEYSFWVAHMGYVVRLNWTQALALLLPSSVAWEH